MFLGRFNHLSSRQYAYYGALVVGEKKSILAGASNHGQGAPNPDSKNVMRIITVYLSSHDMKIAAATTLENMFRRLGLNSHYLGFFY
jgi:hypothetical protein